MRRTALVLIGLALIVEGCSHGRTHPLSGQVLAVDPEHMQIMIKHGDIAGFMPGMTMTFTVKDGRLLEGRVAGDLVTATLVVIDSGSYLSAIERTGHAALTEPAPPVPVPIVEPGMTVSDTEFLDESGASRRLADWRGQTLAVTFIYTRCPLPDFCPRMNRNFAAVQHRMLATAGGRTRAHLLSVSFDPDADTPAILTDYARKAGANPDVWNFLTGRRASIDRFAAQFGVLVMREDGASDLTHNLRTAVIDGEGRLVTILNGNEWEADELVSALRGTK